MTPTATWRDFFAPARDTVLIVDRSRRSYLEAIAIALRGLLTGGALERVPVLFAERPAPPTPDFFADVQEHDDVDDGPSKYRGARCSSPRASSARRARRRMEKSSRRRNRR